MLEGVVFFVLVAIVALRPLISERYDSGVTAITAAISEISDASPIRTLIFDAIIFACAAILFARRPRNEGVSSRGIALTWILFALAGCLSTWFAGQKRIACNASLDWLSLLTLTMVLSRFMTREWHRRILLAAVLASACAQAVQCFDQYFVGFEDTWQFYQARKVEFWASQGVELDSSKVELFERRMQAGEATGWLPHSNVTGSYLVLCGFAALGAMMSAWRKAWKKDGGGTLFVIAAGQSILTFGVFVASGLTFSTGAWVSAVLAGALWLGLALGKHWVNVHRRMAVFAGCVLFLIGIAGTYVYGVTTGGLPGSSLNFRWQYWLASAKLIVDHVWFGVGRENFGRHYLQYKSIESSEEISNPHNFFVQIFSEQGILGLLASVVLLIVVTRIMTRRGRSPVSDAFVSITNRSSVDGARSTWAWCILLVFALLSARSFLLGTADPNFVFVASVMLALPWLIGFAAFAFHAGKISKPEPENRTTYMGVAIGLFAMMIHDMVNFAMFVPGVATTVFALLAYCMTSQNQLKPAIEPRPARQWFPFVLSGLGLIATVTFGLVPVAGAQFHLNRARAGIDVEKNLLAAAACDRWDPAPCAEHAEWMLQSQHDPNSSVDARDKAIQSIRCAIDRDPFYLRHYQTKLAIRGRLAELTSDGGDFLAIDIAQEMIRLYPTESMLYVTLGDCQFSSYRAKGSLRKLREAADSYRKALSLDYQRPKWETIQRLRPRELEAIKKRLHEVEEILERRFRRVPPPNDGPPAEMNS